MIKREAIATQPNSVGTVTEAQQVGHKVPYSIWRSWIGSRAVMT
jgi:hypothetical protein